MSPKPSNQSGGQTHGWIPFKKNYYISLISIFCKSSCFHREWLSLIRIYVILSANLNDKLSDDDLIIKKTKHSENKFVCIKLSRFDFNKPQKLEGFSHAFDLQTGYKVWVFFYGKWQKCTEFFFCLFVCFIFQNLRHRIKCFSPPAEKIQSKEECFNVQPTRSWVEFR